LVLPFVREIVQLFKNETEKKNIDITINVQPEGLGLFADEKQLSQVMINILKNCFQALERRNSGTIEITASKRKDRTIVAIKDNGQGIEEEVLPNIFTPFFSTKAEGTGIGLSICKQIMKMNNGDIHVESKFGSGTTVVLKM
jgi:signal transduction histidine kinase